MKNDDGNKIKDVITMTSKGTFTLPIAIRRALKLENEGESLIIVYDPMTKKAVLNKPVDFPEIQKRLAKYIKNKKPLTDVEAFYQEHHGRNKEGES